MVACRGSPQRLHRGSTMDGGLLGAQLDVEALIIEDPRSPPGRPSASCREHKSPSPAAVGKTSHTERKQTKMYRMTEVMVKMASA